MTRTYDIVKEIINNIDWSLSVAKVTQLDPFTFRLSMCNTSFLKVGETVTDVMNVAFEVVNVSLNSFIDVQVITQGTTWIGNYATVSATHRPTYIHGTHITMNQEYLDMDADTRQKTPLIWLVRGYEERFNKHTQTVKLEVEPVIYFLDGADFENWTSEDHDREAVTPMYNLAKLFVNSVERSTKFEDLEGYRIQDRAKFGVSISQGRGNSKRILSDDLSGVMLRIPLKYRGDCKFC